jgi:hypothetical protein
MSDRLKDAEIAVEQYGWEWVNMHGIRDILLPPEDDERRGWTAMWDENGLPHWLPRYSEGEK